MNLGRGWRDGRERLDSARCDKAGHGRVLGQGRAGEERRGSVQFRYSVLLSKQDQMMTLEDFREDQFHVLHCFTNFFLDL